MQIYLSSAHCTPFRLQRRLSNQRAAPHDPSAPIHNTATQFHNTSAPLTNSSAPSHNSSAPFQDYSAPFQNSSAPFQNSSVHPRRPTSHHNTSAPHHQGSSVADERHGLEMIPGNDRVNEFPAANRSFPGCHSQTAPCFDPTSLTSYCGDADSLRILQVGLK